MVVPSLMEPTKGLAKSSRIDGAKRNYNISVTRKIPENRGISTLFYVELIQIVNIDEWVIKHNAFTDCCRQQCRGNGETCQKRASTFLIEATDYLQAKFIWKGILSGNARWFNSPSRAPWMIHKSPFALRCQKLICILYVRFFKHSTDFQSQHRIICPTGLIQKLPLQLLITQLIQDPEHQFSNWDVDWYPTCNSYSHWRLPAVLTNYNRLFWLHFVEQMTVVLKFLNFTIVRATVIQQTGLLLL